MTLPPLSRNTLHAVIDMQRLFAGPRGWHVPQMAGILPNVLRLCQTTGRHTVYSRFVTPASADAAQGSWRDLYRHYPEVTGLAPHAFDLLDALTQIAASGRQFDKTTYSLLASPEFREFLTVSRCDTLVLSGIETDACVYATLIDAVDRGLRVVVASDAVAGSDLIAHNATLDILSRRLPDQVELATTNEILRAWPA